MIIMALLFPDNISGDIPAFPSLEMTDITVNETSYDISTNISNNTQLINDNFTNIGKYFLFF